MPHLHTMFTFILFLVHDISVSFQLKIGKICHDNMAGNLASKLVNKYHPKKKRNFPMRLLMMPVDYNNWGQIMPYQIVF